MESTTETALAHRCGHAARRHRRGPAGRRHRPRLLVPLLAVAVALVASACQKDITVPPPIALDGPCTASATPASFAWNDAMPAEEQDPDFPVAVWVYEPTGAASPRTGGTCNDSSRPVAFIAHGFGAWSPSFYSHVIANLVRDGHIVVYATYTGHALPDFNVPYNQTNAAFVQAATMSSRMDLENIGIWGHSYGAGMNPWLVQQANARGWGSDSFWMMSNAPFYSFKVGIGPMSVPSHLRALVVSYDNDEKVDHRVAIDQFQSLTIPASQKQYVVLRSATHGGEVLDANHEAVIAPDAFMFANAIDQLDVYGTYRNVQVLADCARDGVNCNADFTYMGTFGDGTPVTPAISTDTPVDMGPLAELGECDSGLLRSMAILGGWWPRPCP